MSNNKKPKKYPSPKLFNNDEATVIWIIVMLVSTIFRDNWMMWIVATVAYLTYIDN